MTFRSLPPNSTTTARSYRDLYQLTHTSAQPAETFRESQAFSYMDASLDDQGAHRAFNLALFNNADARAFLLQQIGFSQADIVTVQTILQNPTTEESQRLKDGLEGHLTDLQRSIFRGMRIVAGYEQPSASGGGNVANPDDRRDTGNPNIVSAYEIENNAGAAAGTFSGEEYRNEMKAQTRTINGILGLLEYVTTQPPPAPRPLGQTRVAQTHTTAEATTLEAPNGGWRTGDQIFINNALWTGAAVPADGSSASVSIPGNAFNVGNNIVEVRNNGIWVTLPVTIQAAGVTPVVAATGPRWYEFWNWSPRTQGEVGAGVAAVGVLTLLGLRLRGARAEGERLRTDLEGPVGRDGRRSGGARGELRDAQGRVLELEGNVRAAGVARVEVGNALMAPEVRARAEAQVTELEGQLREARERVEDLRSGIRFEGSGQRAARQRFDAADSALQAKQAELAAEQAVVRDMEARGADEAGLIPHRERVGILEGEVRAAQEEFNEASRQNLPKADKRGTARGQAIEDISTARAEVRRLEGELAEAQGVVARDNAAGQAVQHLSFLNVRPQAAVPPPPLPNP